MTWQLLANVQWKKFHSYSRRKRVKTNKIFRLLRYGLFHQDCLYTCNCMYALLSFFYFSDLSCYFVRYPLEILFLQLRSTWYQPKFSVGKFSMLSLSVSMMCYVHCWMSSRRFLFYSKPWHCLFGFNLWFLMSLW